MRQTMLKLKPKRSNSQRHSAIARGRKAAERQVEIDRIAMRMMQDGLDWDDAYSRAFTIAGLQESRGEDVKRKDGVLVGVER